MKISFYYAKTITILLLGFFCFVNHGLAQTRVVILSHIENDEGIRKQKDAKVNSRRIVRLISNQLNRRGFEVFRASSGQASTAARRYDADIAYEFWLSMRMHKVDGLCRARANLEGEGYNSSGRSLGIGIDTTTKATQQYCDDAIRKVQKDVAAMVARKLIRVAKKNRHSPIASDNASIQRHRSNRYYQETVDPSID